MPVSTESSISGPYVPNGVTTDFAFDFKATVASEVIAFDQDGATISAALYSVTLDDDEGGTLSFSVAPTLAQYSEIYVAGNPALTQPSDFDNAGPSFNPAALTRALDRAAERDLRQQREIDRAFKVPFGETGFQVPAEAERAGYYLGFNASGAPIPIEGTGDDGTVRPDLASPDAGKGAALIAKGQDTVRNIIPITPEQFGAVGDGVADDTAAIQAAIDAVADGGTILFRATYKVTASITATGKRFTMAMEGVILDRAAAWTKNFADLTATGKGLFAFLASEITIIGRGATHFDGGRGEAGVDQTTRILLYFYDCDRVFIDGINTVKGLHASVGTFKCRNITHRNCSHDQGEFAALHSRPTDCLVDNVRVTNALFNGITCLNRGEFSSGVLAETRGLRVTVRDCYVFNTDSTNSYAVGITIDSCDQFVASGNVVDGSNTGTMCYSWAGSTRGRIFGNEARNLTNTANGADTYAGIGHELDTVSDIEAFGNTFSEVLFPYLIVDADRVRVSGTSVCDAAREANTSTAVGRCSFAMISNSASGTSSDIVVSGTADGHTVFMEIAASAEVDGLTLENVTARDQFLRVINANAGAILTRFTVNGMRVEEPGAAKSVFNFADNTLKDCSISNVRAKAASAPGTNQRFFYGEAAAAIYSFSDIEIENYDVGIRADHYNRVSSVAVNGLRARGVAGNLVDVAGSSVAVKDENVTLAGVAQRSKGNNASTIYGTAAPTNQAKFIGQKFVNTTTGIVYEAIATAGVAADWKRSSLNPSATIASPSGGATIDSEARTAIDAIRAALTAQGVTL